MEHSHSLIARARTMVLSQGGLTRDLYNQLRTAGYEPGYLAALVAVWKEQS